MTDSHRTYGILLINTGTPDAPTPPALRRYLAQFLGDPRVIEYPRWLWRSALGAVSLLPCAVSCNPSSATVFMPPWRR